MKVLNDDFLDDSSAALGLSHSATEAEPVRNYLLSDTEWLEKNNERLEREALERGEALAPSVDEKTGEIRDRDFNAQFQAEFERIAKERKDLSLPAQLNLARSNVSKRQRQQHRNQGAYGEVGREIVRLKREHPEWSLMECTLQARHNVEERSKPVITGEAMSGSSERPQTAEQAYLGDKPENLMKREGLSITGGGGSKSRRRSGKKGTWICRLCHLEYCEHRPKSNNPSGRPRKEGAARRVRRRVKMTDSTLSQIKAAGIGESDALALFAIAYRERRPLDDVLKEWKARNATDGAAA